MARRAFCPLSLLLVASLHCGEVLGQDAVEPTLTGVLPDTPGGEQSAPQGGASPSCLEQLAEAGVAFRPARTGEPEPIEGCGMTDGVSVTRGPSGIRYQPPIRLSCRFALELPAIERTIQAAAREALGEPVEVARTMGSYGCRNIQSTRSPGRLSEHAFGNAIDVGEWRTRRRRAVVLRDFRAEAPEGAFLRAVATRLRESGALERLLDPDSNAAHRNHFHLEGRPLP